MNKRKFLVFSTSIVLSCTAKAGSIMIVETNSSGVGVNGTSIFANTDGTIGADVSSGNSAVYPTSYSLASNTTQGGLDFLWDPNPGSDGPVASKFAWNVSGGGSINVIFEDTSASLTTLSIITIGNVTGLSLDWFTSVAIADRDTSTTRDRVIGLTARQNTGNVTAVGTQTYYGLAGTALLIDSIVDTNTTALESINADSLDPTGTIATANDLTQLNNRTNDNASVRLGLTGGGATAFLSGIRTTAFTTGGLPFDEGTEFRFTLDGSTFASTTANTTLYEDFGSPIPEPSSALLCSLGLLGMISRRKR